jgi:hypothetical protein
MRICMTISNKRHCFDIPDLVNQDYFHRPPPPNYPELELAATILQLVEHIKPAVRDTEFTKSLTELSTRFIQKVQEGLPKGVELITTQAMDKAA